MEWAQLAEKCQSRQESIEYVEQGKTYGGNSRAYMCGGIPMGSVAEGKVDSQLKSLGPVSGSLYPPRIGAEQQAQWSLHTCPIVNLTRDISNTAESQAVWRPTSWTRV